MASTNSVEMSCDSTAGHNGEFGFLPAHKYNQHNLNLTKDHIVKLQAYCNNSKPILLEKSLLKDK